MAYPDIENSILENNLFGVDINEESVEIAKLSLWLRTAQPKRKLNNLNDNIQCGNSLIHDPEVAGDKAFNWQTAFPQVFAKGGFDVVIGNPPYGAKLAEKHISFYRTNYETIIGHAEVYYIFTEKALNQLISDKGIMGFIIPNAWLSNKYAGKLRKVLLSKNIEILINFNRKVIFEDANVETSIIIASNSNKDVEVKVGQDLHELYDFNQNDWLKAENNIMSFAANKSIDLIIKKVQDTELQLSDKLDISNGIKPYQAGYGLNLDGEPLSKEDVKNKIYHSQHFINEEYKREIKGKGVKRYLLDWEESYIKWGKWLMSPKSVHYFEQPKILLRQIISDYFYAVIDEQKYYADQSLYVCTHYPDQTEIPLEFYLGLLNSRLYGFYFRKYYSEEDDLFPKIKVAELKSLPVKIPDENSIIEMTRIVEKITYLYKKTSDKYYSFRSFFMESIGIEKPTRKLENWYELSFSNFIKELTKAIKTTNKIRSKEGQSPIAELTKKDEFEWMELFEFKKQEVIEFQKQIQQTEQEIDQMVYKLYDLTEDEIAIIEAS